MATILVIDDDAAFRSTMSDVLRQAGHVVEAAPDGKQALAIYNAGRHDLIITEIS